MPIWREYAPFPKVVGEAKAGAVGPDANMGKSPHPV
jgi:hypothetical protein